MGRPEFSSSVTVANEYTLIGIGSVYNTLIVGVAVIEVKCGAEKLENRTTVTVQAAPVNSGEIYLGIDNTVTANKCFYALAAGAGITLKLDSADAISIYAIGSAAGQKLNILEGKA